VTELVADALLDTSIAPPLEVALLLVKAVNVLGAMVNSMS
jgi:hypothetical protein